MTTSSSSDELSSQSGYRREFDVALHGRTIGGIHRRGGTIAFAFDDDYQLDPGRSVLGLLFEESPRTVYYSNNRMAWWFENLLPEGDLAVALGADDRSATKFDREAGLFQIAGADLAGAVQIFRTSDARVPVRVGLTDAASVRSPVRPIDDASLRFSVAGVGLKFSMRRSGARFVVPSSGEYGHWLLKLPDRSFPSLPLNEYATMSLASSVGIDVPRIALVDRDQVDTMRDSWWAGENHAFAIERFDRNQDGSRVHIEDIAQVRGVYSGQKYEGNVETVANLMYRGRDADSLIEFTRRLAFNLMVGNSDAHLKNWSLRYVDHRRPQISPAYDLVAVVGYGRSGVDTSLALRFANRKSYDLSLGAFDRLARKVGAREDLRGVAVETVERVIAGWGMFEEQLSSEVEILRLVREHASLMAQRLIGVRW